MEDKQRRTRWEFTDEFKRDADELVRVTGGIAEDGMRGHVRDQPSPPRLDL